jgi:molybdenum cofactor biosynthesis enzyme MoaA
MFVKCVQSRDFSEIHISQIRFLLTDGREFTVMYCTARPPKEFAWVQHNPTLKAMDRVTLADVSSEIKVSLNMKSIILF